MKASMFNIVDRDKDNNLLLFNGLKGIQSICKIKNENSEPVMHWLDNDFDSSKKYNTMFKELKKRGYFIDDHVNEIETRNFLYMQRMMSNYLILVIHTTKNCNFRCRYCALEFQKDVLTDETKEGIVNFIAKNISKYCGVRINWFGGEPLMNIATIEEISEKVIALCRMAKKPYSSNITTNGYLLTPTNIDKLIKSRVTEITVTVDGLKETHDKNRVLIGNTPTFDTIINNLLYIKNHIDTRTMKITIRSNITLEMMMPDYLEKYYDFYNSNFGGDSRFHLFVRPVRDWGGDSVKQLKNSLLDTYQLDMSVAYRFLAQHIKDIDYSGNMNDLHLGGITCPGKQLNKFTVTTDGFINKCDDGGYELSLGKLYSNGKMEINDFLLPRWTINSYSDNIKCDSCKLSCLCFMDGCPKHRLQCGSTSCAISEEEVKGLMQLYAASYPLTTL